MTKSISLDVWGTLLKSNPEYSVQQEKLVKEFFDVENWREKKKIIKIMIKKDEEMGIQSNRLEKYRQILPNISVRDLRSFIKYSDELFLKYPPILKEPDTDIVSILKEKGYKCYISSNTTLIYGDVMSKVIFDNFGIIHQNCKFSDEVGVTKPRPEMFSFSIKPTYHIGDNLITDGASERFGIKHYHINDKQNFKTFLENEGI